MDHTVPPRIRLNEKACILPSTPEFSNIESGVRTPVDCLTTAIYNSVALL